MLRQEFLGLVMDLVESRRHWSRRQCTYVLTKQLLSLPRFDSYSLNIRLGTSHFSLLCIAAISAHGLRATLPLDCKHVGNHSVSHSSLTDLSVESD